MIYTIYVLLQVRENEISLRKWFGGTAYLRSCAPHRDNCRLWDKDTSSLVVLCLCWCQFLGFSDLANKLFHFLLANNQR